jgi:hypothetical protein
MKEFRYAVGLSIPFRSIYWIWKIYSSRTSMIV